MSYTQTVTTTAINAHDAYAKVQAYRKLFNLSANVEVLTFAKGYFYDKQGDCCFLNRQATLVTITQRSIKWYDPACHKEIVITNDPHADNFELTLKV